MFRFFAFMFCFERINKNAISQRSKLVTGRFCIPALLFRQFTLKLTFGLQQFVLFSLC
jgi:hypothetical protein